MDMPFILGLYHHFKQQNMITGNEKLNIKDEDILFQGKIKIPENSCDIFPDNFTTTSIKDNFPLNQNDSLEFSGIINNSDDLEFPGYYDSLEDLL